MQGQNFEDVCGETVYKFVNGGSYTDKAKGFKPCRIVRDGKIIKVSKNPNTDRVDWQIIRPKFDRCTEVSLQRVVTAGGQFAVIPFKAWIDANYIVYRI